VPHVVLDVELFVLPPEQLAGMISSSLEVAASKSSRTKSGPASAGFS
jgi:hypothetical protein